MKKTIEVRYNDGIHFIDAEIYKRGDYTFGLYWDSKKYELTIVETSTGFMVGSLSYRDTRSPRQDMINKVIELVDTGEMGRGSAKAKERLSQKVRTLKQEITSIEQKIYDLERTLNTHL